MRVFLWCPQYFIPLEAFSSLPEKKKKKINNLQYFSATCWNKCTIADQSRSWSWGMLVTGPMAAIVSNGNVQFFQVFRLYKNNNIARNCILLYVITYQNGMAPIITKTFDMNLVCFQMHVLLFAMLPPCLICSPH